MSTVQIEGEVLSHDNSNAGARVITENLNQRFVFAHFPLEWELVGVADGDAREKEWLPKLAQPVFRRGVNGQPNDSDQSLPIAHLMKKKAAVFPPGDARLGPFRNYVKRFPAYNPKTKGVGYYYGSIFETAKQVGNRVRMTHDTDRFDEFRRFLVSRQLITAIDSDVVFELIEREENILSQVIGLPRTPARAADIEAREKLLSAMRESHAEMLENEAATALAIEESEDGIVDGEIEVEEPSSSTPKASARRRISKEG